jgi:hypothetical protein
MRNSCKLSVRNPEWKRPFRKPYASMRDNIKMWITKISWEWELYSSGSGEGTNGGLF